MSSDPTGAAPLVPTNFKRRRFATGRTVVALLLREMSTQYGNSPGGYIWALVEPLGAILMLSLAFSLLVRNPPLGNDFLLFYATGFIPLNIFLSIHQAIGGALGFSKPLLMYPTVTWLDAVTARFLLNSLSQAMVAYLLFTGISILSDTRSVLNMVPIILAITEAMLLALGVGMVNCVLFGLFPIWSQVWGILTRPLFLASGVFFLYEGLPPMVQSLLWYNPIIHLTGTLRDGFYPTYNPTYISHLYVLGLSLGMILLGMILLGRYHRDILNR